MNQLNDFEVIKRRVSYHMVIGPLDYAVILKKVGAIVAEGGGITAHVSVISREFNIPAIVGVSNVTINLKDNQEVEVDAENGTVKIIKRSSS